jgi:hypothetical protein
VNEPQQTGLPIRRPQNTILRLALVLGGLLLGCPPGVLRADNLDLALLDHGEELVQECQTKGYKVVGTLKFRVHIGNAGKGKTEPLGRGEPLASNLADRLENLLVINTGPKYPLKVIHAAGKAAGNRDIRVNLGKPATLFNGPYELAWGTERVRTADAFFTGEVVLADDLRTAKVHLDCLDKTAKLIRRLSSFTVDVDRSILADAGLPFHLDPVARQLGSPDKLDRAAILSAQNLRKGGTGGATREPDLVHVTVYPLNAGRLGEKALLPRKGNQPALLPFPPGGQSIGLRVENPGPNRVGVFLKVAGRSTKGEQIDEGNRCSRWIIEPGKEKSITGYLLKPEREKAPLLTIRRTTESDVIPAVDDLIEWCVYVPAAEEQPRPTISLRGLDETERRRSNGTLERLQTHLLRRAGIKRNVKRSVETDDVPVVPGEEILQKAVFAEYCRIRFSD